MSVFNTDNKKYFLSTKPSKKSFWMISEASCDTEDWSNDAEHLAYFSSFKYLIIIQSFK